jgi:hypothetical protein
MKIIYVKDPHFKYGFQTNRTDYVSDMDRKLEIISNMMVSQNIEDIVFSGDFYDVTAGSKWTFSHLYKNHLAIEKFFKTHNLKLHTIFGNHDFLNGDYDDKKKTPLYNTSSIGLINDLYENPILNSSVSIYGIDYIPENEFNDVFSNKMEGIVKNHSLTNPDSKLMIVTHQTFTKNVENFTEMTFGELINNYPEVDYWGTGHYHKGEGVVKLKGKTFIDPNNLFRTSNSDRTPQYVVIDFDTGSTEVFNFDMFDGQFKTRNVEKKSLDIDLKELSKKLDDLDGRDTEMLETIVNSYKDLSEAKRVEITETLKKELNL